MVTVVVAIGACETATAPEPLNGRLTASDVWSGGEALVVSAAFLPPALPVARIAAETLAVRRVDDSTVAARLPHGNGPGVLTVELPGFAPFTTIIRLRGFRTAEDGPFLTGFLQRLPTPPLVLGAGDPGLVEVDVRTGAVARQWPDTVHSPDCTWGVGPSVRSGGYVLFGKTAGGTCSHPWLWTYGPQLTRVDSLYALVDTWAIGEVGPGGAVFGSDDHLHISQCTGTGCADRLYSNLGGSLTGITVGSVAKRAVLHHWNALVADAEAGDTLYRIPYTQAGYRTEGAAFSAGEDTLYAVGQVGGSVGASEVMAVAAANGAYLGGAIFPGSGTWAFDVARDPVRHWLYVATLVGSGATNVVPAVVVLDQGTLAPIAELRAPTSEALSLIVWHQFRLVPDPSQAAVYMVATKQAYDLHGERARIFRFDLIP